MDQEKPVLSLSVCQLGAEGKARSFDLSVTSYLRSVTLDYCDLPGQLRPQSSPVSHVHVAIYSSARESFALCCSSCASCSGGRNDSLHLISSDQQGSDLLKVEFIKVSSSSETRGGASAPLTFSADAADVSPKLQTSLCRATGNRPARQLSSSNMSCLSCVYRLIRRVPVFRRSSATPNKC